MAGHGGTPLGSAPVRLMEALRIAPTLNGSACNNVVLETRDAVAKEMQRYCTHAIDPT
jgi:hypothetical protein